MRNKKTKKDKVFVLIFCCCPLLLLNNDAGGGSPHPIDTAGAQLVAVLTALDRQERGAEGTRSAVQMLEAELQVPVRAIVTLDDILDWLATENQLGEQAALAAYRARYGASA